MSFNKKSLKNFQKKIFLKIFSTFFSKDISNFLTLQKLKKNYKTFETFFSERHFKFFETSKNFQKIFFENFEMSFNKNMF